MHGCDIVQAYCGRSRSHKPAPASRTGLRGPTLDQHAVCTAWTELWTEFTMPLVQVAHNRSNALCRSIGGPPTAMSSTRTLAFMVAEDRFCRHACLPLKVRRSTAPPGSMERLMGCHECLRSRSVTPVRMDQPLWVANGRNRGRDRCVNQSTASGPHHQDHSGLFGMPQQLYQSWRVPGLMAARHFPPALQLAQRLCTQPPEALYLQR